MDEMSERGDGCTMGFGQQQRYKVEDSERMCSEG